MKLGGFVSSTSAVAFIPRLRPYLDQNGDWGVVSPADAKENDFSVKLGFRALSSYAVGRAGELLDRAPRTPQQRDDLPGLWYSLACKWRNTDTASGGEPR